MLYIHVLKKKKFSHNTHVASININQWIETIFYYYEYYKGYKWWTT